MPSLFNYEGNIMQNNEHAAIQKPRRKRTREEIKILIDKWKSSKLSRTEFCRREGLCLQTFCYWAKQSELKPETKSPMSFISMPPTGQRQAIDEQFIEIKLPNGLQCRFSKFSDIKIITQLAQGLAHVISH